MSIFIINFNTILYYMNSERILYIIIGFVLCSVIYYFYSLYNANKLNCSGPCLPYCFTCTKYIYIIFIILCVMLYYMYNYNKLQKKYKKQYYD